jgi:hypothetical protein
MREVTRIHAEGWAVRIERITTSETVPDGSSGQTCADHSDSADGGEPQLMPDWELRADAA